MPAHPQKAVVVRDVKGWVVSAQKHSAAGQRLNARKCYEEACKVGFATVVEVDPLLVCTAVLGYVNLVLEDGAWPELSGKPPDVLLMDAIEVARSAKQRVRSLEGQLLLMQSQALFAKPDKSMADLDGAIDARQAGVNALLEGAVEALPWKVESAEALFLQVYANASGHERMAEAEVFSSLQVLGKAEDAASDFSTLFDAWAGPGIEGGAPIMSLAAFLEQFVDAAKRLDRAIDKPDCKAPCEGGLPNSASELEKALVLLVSTHGAGEWQQKAEQLCGMGHADATSLSVQELWTKLLPLIKKTVDADAPMSCGHSCSTCPTHDTCKVHDALKDIEDL